MPKTILDILRNAPIFAELDDVSLSRLAQNMRRRKFPPKSALFHEGDPGLSFYIIVSGRVNAVRTNPRGETVHIARFGPGEVIGELAVLDGMPRSADAITSEETDALIIDQSALIDLLEHSSSAAMAMLKALAKRLRNNTEKTQKQRLPVQARLCGLLAGEAESHGVFMDGATHIKKPLNRSEIAVQIGAARETVSRALSRLKKMQVIRETPFGWTVNDPGRLSRLAKG